MATEITQDMANEMVQSIVDAANEEFERQKSTSANPELYGINAKYYHAHGWLKSAFATAIVKAQLTKKDLNLK